MFGRRSFTPEQLTRYVEDEMQRLTGCYDAPGRIRDLKTDLAYYRKKAEKAEKDLGDMLAAMASDGELAKWKKLPIYSAGSKCPACGATGSSRKLATLRACKKRVIEVSCDCGTSWDMRPKDWKKEA